MIEWTSGSLDELVVVLRKSSICFWEGLGGGGALSEQESKKVGKIRKNKVSGEAKTFPEKAKSKKTDP